MDGDRFTVRLAEGNERGTRRVTFFLGASWVATFHTCGDTVGIAVMRRGREGAEPLLRQRVLPIPDLLTYPVREVSGCGAVGRPSGIG